MSAPARLLGALSIMAVLVAAGAAWFVRPRLTDEEEGRRLAERSGCFACHGPEATRGAPNPGDKDPVPGFGGGVLMMDTPKGAPDVRDWIVEGTRGMDLRKEAQARQDSLKRSAQGLAPAPVEPDTANPVLEMPSFRGRFSDRHLNQLAAFILAQDRFVLDQAPPEVQAGAELARKVGCFNCHGSLGLLDRPNPGSLKGYIPAWRGPDAEELVSSHKEFSQWVQKGWPEKFTHNAAANWFRRREQIRMPEYKDHLADSELAQLDSLYFWVRAHTP